ncbi:TadE/TadG family type IV pilus assembly protein [Tabrizicola sp.]|uniref:TadE/TadG family type IV pilus assembly protein n=1 Tax=Tabrizicola sp. TaxID=2005166 RepID=UPI003D2D421E
MRLRDFIRQTSGVAAIEFAIIAPILILFTFGIIELGRAFFFKQNLVTATDAAARLLYIEPTTDLVTLKATIADQLFLAEDKRLTVASSPAGTADAPRILLQVEYEYNSLLPSLVLESFDMTLEREVHIRPTE